MIDPAAVAALVVELEATTYHQAVRAYVERRMTALQTDDVTDPYVAMKRRGQLEELARLLAPATTQGLALLSLERRARAEAVADARTPAPPPPREWWLEPSEEPVQ